ncbi:MAG: S4 domain-containing protein [Synergistetes bacterium]|nr:S4 domain-containing protein [Synergistota bacterium]MCX8128270.1 S4 domain-containing protein [Synergistota bacterium]MDW8192717.1 S4 domain-containing protein [Synergistota bacterium]
MQKEKPGIECPAFIFTMRLDKFLKESGIIKRRTLAREMIEKGLVLLNEKEVKPSSSVKEGDRIRIFFPYKVKNFEVKVFRSKSEIEILELKE